MLPAWYIPPNIPVRAIARVIAGNRNLTFADIIGRKRGDKVVAARKAIVREAIKQGHSYSRIARALYRHHTTIMHHAGVV
jgi:chromosomal replication initiation ATPase DnaA